MLEVHYVLLHRLDGKGDVEQNDAVLFDCDAFSQWLGQNVRAQYKITARCIGHFCQLDIIQLLKLS